MRIALSDPGTKDRGGDVVALDELLQALTRYRAEHPELDERSQIILGLWTRYLGDIQNHILAVDCDRATERRSLSLPFEKDFAKMWKEPV